MFIIRIIIRLLGWVLVILFFLFGGLGVLIGGALTFPLGILFWIIGGIGWFVFLSLFITARESWIKSRTIKKTVPNQLRVAAQKLYQDYETNEIAADGKYKNKAIEVSGTISNIGKDIMNATYVMLETCGSEIAGIQCYVNILKTNVATLQKGQYITIKGICDGKNQDLKTPKILLQKCIFKLDTDRTKALTC